VIDNYIHMKGQPRRELQRETSQSYRLEQVVADLVDNSIDAGANQIEIIFNEEPYNNTNSHYLIVLDNGKGITGEKISSVMDFGAPRVYDELELGKFGVGMKSSSLSHAKEITLMSKVKGESIELRRLSYEVVNELDEWVLLSEIKPHMHTHAIDVARNQLDSRESGTAIILEDMHKLDLQVGHQEQKKEYLAGEYAIIREYLSLVFEQYINGIELQRSDDTKLERKIEISFNGKHDILTPLDPFCRDQQDGSSTGTLKFQKDVTLQLDGVTANVSVKIWITPKEEDRKPGYDSRLNTASRDLGIRELQGLYFYRNGRLIDFPGWKKLVKVEEHMTCLRWEIDFPSIFDDIFQLDPSKREIQLPMELREQLIKLTKTKFRWHKDDQKATNHRARARIRQGGKDAYTIVPPPKPSPKEPVKPTKTPSSGTEGNPIGPGSGERTTAQALKEVIIENVPGSKTGKLVINELQKGDTWVVTLNSNHAMYKEFLEKVKV
jgi:hypothetical protein